jgi:CelD/BcsL family acetyltransferase involved in cellulose biosynthesis
MRISVVRPSDLGPAEIAAWHSLQAKTDSLANPFLSPEFTVAVGRVRSCARVAVLADGPKIVGFFPFERRKLGLGMPIAAGLTDCQGLIHGPGVEWDSRSLLRACKVSAWQFDHLVAGQQPFERYQATLAPSPVIDLWDGFKAYDAALRSSKHRFSRELARKARKLGREVGEVRFVADSRDVGDLHTLMAWKSEQYRRTGRLDRFSQPWIVALLEALLDTRNDRFSSLLSMMYAGDVPVAAHFGVRFDRVLAGWFPVYDRRFSAYSVGLINNLRMVEAAAAAGVSLIEMGKGTRPYKEILKSRDTFVAEGIVTRRSPLAAAHWARSVPQAWVIRQIRGHPPLFNATDRLLRQVGQMRDSLPSRHRVAQVPTQDGPAERNPSERVMSPP